VVKQEKFCILKELIIGTCGKDLGKKREKFGVKCKVQDPGVSRSLVRDFIR